MNKFFSNDPDENYIFLNNQFLKVIDKHIPLEIKNLKENQAPFVDKQFRKEISLGVSLGANTAKILPSKMKSYKRNKGIYLNILTWA